MSFEKAEQHRVWELEEQLADEQYALKKTKFALRNVQEALKQTSIADGSQTADFFKNLELCGNQETEEKLKDLEKMVEDLKKENSSLRVSQNVPLEKFNREEAEMVKKLKLEKKELQYELERQSENLADFERKLGYVEIEKKNLEQEMKSKNEKIEELNRMLKEQSDKIEGLEKRIDELVESNKDVFKIIDALNTKNKLMKVELDKQCRPSSVLDDFKESTPPEVVSLQNSLNMLYTEATLSDKTVHNVLELAVKYGSKSMMKQAEKFLVESSKLEMKVKLEWAVKYKLHGLKEACLSQTFTTTEEIEALLPDELMMMNHEVMAKLFKQYISITAPVEVTVKASSGRFFSCQFRLAFDTVKTLKWRIEEKWKINPDSLHLIFQRERMFEGGRLLASYGICDKSLIYTQPEIAWFPCLKCRDRDAQELYAKQQAQWRASGN